MNGLINCSPINMIRREKQMKNNHPYLWFNYLINNHKMLCNIKNRNENMKVNRK
jgi:hypothetical protein